MWLDTVKSAKLAHTDYPAQQSYIPQNRYKTCDMFKHCSTVGSVQMNISKARERERGRERVGQIKAARSDVTTQGGMLTSANPFVSH